MHPYKKFTLKKCLNTYIDLFKEQAKYKPQILFQKSLKKKRKKKQHV